jgi:hypothetical protein
MKRKAPRSARPRAKARRSAKAPLTPVKRRQLAAALHRSAPAHPPEIARPHAQPTDGEQELVAARLHQLAPDAPPATPRATPYRGG